MKEREETVNLYLSEVMKKKKVILPQHSLVEDLGLNSIQLISLIEKVETKYDVMVPIQKLHVVKTVEDLYKMVCNLEEICQ